MKSLVFLCILTDGDTSVLCDSLANFVKKNESLDEYKKYGNVYALVFKVDRTGNGNKSKLELSEIDLVWICSLKESLERKIDCSELRCEVLFSTETCLRLSEEFKQKWINIDLSKVSNGVFLTCPFILKKGALLDLVSDIIEEIGKQGELEELFWLGELIDKLVLKETNLDLADLVIKISQRLSIPLHKLIIYVYLAQSSSYEDVELADLIVKVAQTKKGTLSIRKLVKLVVAVYVELLNLIEYADLADLIVDIAKRSSFTMEDLGDFVYDIYYELLSYGEIEDIGDLICDVKRRFSLY